MEHLNKFGARLGPLGQLARCFVVRPVAQDHAWQCPQNGFCVIGPYPKAQAHMGQLELHVQGRIAGDDTAHEHVTAATGVLGQGMN